MTDGDGFLLISWDHHGLKLNYVRSVAPLSLQLTEKMRYDREV
jgi:urease gamma subunit